DTKRASPDLQAQFQLRQEQLHTSGASGILTFTLAHASAGALHAATLDPLPQRLMLNNEAPRKLQEGGIDGSPFAGENKNCPVVKSGPVAQLGARFHGMEEVVGSIPTRSTIFSYTTDIALSGLGAFGRKFTIILSNFPRFGFCRSSLLIASTVACTLAGISCM